MQVLFLLIRKTKTDSNISSYNHMEEILLSTVPLGFSQNRSMVHHVAHVLQKFASTERFDFLSYQENTGLLKLVVSLLVYWISEKYLLDSYMTNSIADILELLCKCESFAIRLKQSAVVHHLMG